MGKRGMKALFLSLFCLAAFAGVSYALFATINAPQEAKIGETVTFTVSLSEPPTSCDLTVTAPSGMETHPTPQWSADSLTATASFVAGEKGTWDVGVVASRKVGNTAATAMMSTTVSVGDTKPNPDPTPSSGGGDGCDGGTGAIALALIGGLAAYRRRK